MGQWLPQRRSWPGTGLSFMAACSDQVLGTWVHVTRDWRVTAASLACHDGGWTPPCSPPLVHAFHHRPRQTHSASYCLARPASRRPSMGGPGTIFLQRRHPGERTKASLVQAACRADNSRAPPDLATSPLSNGTAALRRMSAAYLGSVT